MAIDVLEVTVPSLAYISLGGFVVLFSLVSLLVREKLYINEVVLGTGFGIIIGPYVANVIDPRSWGSEENTVTLEFLRVVLATGLFAVGVELPCAYMKHYARSLLVMVVPTMAFGWVVVSAVLHMLFPRLDIVSALCIAACLTPTDPVTCAVITRGKFATMHVPVAIRRILSAESAANDGMAYPFLSISLYLTVETSTRVAIGKWFLIGWLYQVILGTVLGAVLGLLFSKLLKISHQNGLNDHESYISQYLALSIFIMGVASTIGADDLLAAFAAGCTVSWDGHFKQLTAHDSFSSVIDYVFNSVCFIYIGAWLPFDSYNSPELGITPWRLVMLLLAILVLRRIPSLLLLYRWVPEISSWKEALFCGHFGPMGVSAIFVSALARTTLPVPANPPANQAELLAATIQPIVSFVVLGSIVIHGLSIPFFNLGREVNTGNFSVSWTGTRVDMGGLPDWIFYVRRPGENEDVPATIADVEQGIQTNVNADLIANSTSKQTFRSPLSPLSANVPAVDSRTGGVVSVMNSYVSGSDCGAGSQGSSEVTSNSATPTELSSTPKTEDTVNGE